MGSDRKTFVLADAALAQYLKSEVGVSVRENAWIEIEGDVRADLLSAQRNAVVVEWSIQTTVDQIWIKTFASGQRARELLYDGGRWTTVSGTPLPCENASEIDRWLKSEKLLASPDGYGVLDAFLGAPAEERIDRVHADRFGVRPPPPPTEAERRLIQERVAKLREVSMKAMRERHMQRSAGKPDSE